MSHSMYIRGNREVIIGFYSSINHNKHVRIHQRVCSSPNACVQSIFDRYLLSAIRICSSSFADS